jgi:site-specific DNA recombinase
MDPKLCEVFCREYTDHVNHLRMERNATRSAHQMELERTQRSIAKLIEAIKSGCDPRDIKDELNGLSARKDELTAALDTIEAAPVLIHPNMASRYHQEVQRLIVSFNEPESREVSAEVIRNLIEKVELTPNAERTALVVDLYGHLAGILQMSEIHARRGKAAPCARLSNVEEAEVEQARAVAGLSGSIGYDCKAVLVAGAGFEPATFRL